MDACLGYGTTSTLPSNSGIGFARGGPLEPVTARLLTGELGKCILNHDTYVDWANVEPDKKYDQRELTEQLLYAISYVQRRSAIDDVWILPPAVEKAISFLAAVGGAVWMDRLAFHRGMEGKDWAVRGLRPYTENMVLAVGFDERVEHLTDAKIWAQGFELVASETHVHLILGEDGFLYGWRGWFPVWSHRHRYW